MQSRKQCLNIRRKLSPYWARVDLGDKGVWFRFFAGYFQTKEEAEKFIRELNIQGATPAKTRYANLIGIFSSDKEVEDQRTVVVSAGFYPYVIQGADGLRVLFSGAFDRKEYAERSGSFSVRVSERNHGALRNTKRMKRRIGSEIDSNTVQ
jgi:hypothetical protein